MPEDPAIAYVLLGSPERSGRTRATTAFLLQSGATAMSKVFISHSVKDRKFVEDELVGLCRAFGLQPWYSEQDILGASEWEGSIRNGLESSEWVVLVMSTHSEDSRWVKNEVHWALEHRQMGVIPILIEPCNRSKIHLQLERLQFIDFTRDLKRARESLISVFIGTIFPAGSEYVPTTRSALDGIWLSYWESKVIQEPAWVSETLEIKSRGRFHTVRATQNSAGYDWSGTGRFHTNQVFSMDWRVEKVGAESEGVATFYRNAEGHYLVGHWYGLNGGGVPSIGRWIIIREQYDPIALARQWFGKSAKDALSLTLGLKT